MLKIKKKKTNITLNCSIKHIIVNYPNMHLAVQTIKTINKDTF